MFSMLGVFAEFERAMLVERIGAGLRRAKAQGVKLGRPHSRCRAARPARIGRGGQPPGRREGGWRRPGHGPADQGGRMKPGQDAPGAHDAPTPKVEVTLVMVSPEAIVALYKKLPGEDMLREEVARFYDAYPERFPRGLPQSLARPEAVWMMVPADPDRPFRSVSITRSVSS
jgi:Resolvase, N terminal domain